MKKFSVLLFCLILALASFGQVKTEKIISVPEVEVNQPRFTGVKNVAHVIDGNYTMDIKKYLAANVKYPENAANCFKEGTEVISFLVTPAGNITNFKVINSVCPEIDKEIIRVLASTDGEWIPGLNDGKPTPMPKEVSMVFCVDRFNNDNVIKYFTKKATTDFKKGTKKLLLSHNTKRALRNFDHGLTYLPYDKSLLYMRGLCRYELGDEQGAHEDWDRITKLGGFEDGTAVSRGLKSMKGYSEMAEKLNIK